MPVVPATRTLVEVAAQSPQIAHLWGGQSGSGFGKRGIIPANFRMRGNICDGSERPDANAAIGSCRDAVQPSVGNFVQRDQRGRGVSAVANFDGVVPGVGDGGRNTNRGHFADTIDPIGPMGSMVSAKMVRIYG